MHGSYKETNTDKSTIVELQLNRPDPSSVLRLHAGIGGDFDRCARKFGHYEACKPLNYGVADSAVILTRASPEPTGNASGTRQDGHGHRSSCLLSLPGHSFTWLPATQSRDIGTASLRVVKHHQLLQLASITTATITTMIAIFHQQLHSNNIQKATRVCARV